MIENRFKKYTMAAGTTAALATAGSTHAGIVSSDGPVSVNAGSLATLLSFKGVNVRAGNMLVDGYWDRRTASISASSASDFVLRLHQSAISGSTIDADWAQVSTARQVFGQIENKGGGTSTKISQLSAGTNQLAAFSILDDTDRYFGWIDYSLEASGTVSDPFNFVINSWAYNDVAGQGIIAGQDTAASDGGGAAVPGLGGLAGLAIGAAGVRTRRQRIA